MRQAITTAVFIGLPVWGIVHYARKDLREIGMTWRDYLDYIGWRDRRPR